MIAGLSLQKIGSISFPKLLKDTNKRQFKPSRLSGMQNEKDGFTNLHLPIYKAFLAQDE